MVSKGDSAFVVSSACLLQKVGLRQYKRQCLYNNNTYLQGNVAG